MTLPIRQFNRSMTTLDLYYGMSFDSVVKQADGTLSVNYDPGTRFFIGKEDLDSWITDNKSYMLENGQKCSGRGSDSRSFPKQLRQKPERRQKRKEVSEAAEVISVEAPQAGHTS